MKKLLFLFPILLLSACGEEPQATGSQPASTQAAPAQPTGPDLPAPDARLFSSLFAKTCPEAKEISNSACRRAGFGSEEVTCEYGLGKDEYLRHKAKLIPEDGEWTIADPETVCAQGA